MSEFQFGNDIVWRPSAEIIAQSRLKQFMDRHSIGSLEELQRRSTEEIEWFWSAVLEELGIEFYVPYERIVDAPRGIDCPRVCRGGFDSELLEHLAPCRGDLVWGPEARRLDGAGGGGRRRTAGTEVG